MGSDSENLPKRPSGSGNALATKSDAQLSEAESGQIPEKPPKKSKKEKFFTKLFGSEYNLKESIYVLIAAIIIALNGGFINGACMSGLLIEGETDSRNPSSQMVAGFAGAFTNTANAMLSKNWDKYIYNVCMIASYMGGAFLSAMINPRAKPYVIEAKYGPTFMFGGTMLLGASLLAKYMYPSRYVFFLSTASLGLQNGVASLYSANLIRCTLTGAVTDIGIVIAQGIHCRFKSLARGIVLSIIVFNFWLGGIVAYYAVQVFTTETLFFSSALFYSCGVIQIIYLIKELGVSFYDALFGTWKWKNVLQKLDNEDGELTAEKMIKIFKDIDASGDNNGEIDIEELTIGLRAAKVEMTDYEIKTLFRAADDDGNGTVDEDEWNALVKKIL